VREKIADLAAALSDERDDDDVGGGAAGDRAEECALPDAGAGEEADALSFAEGQQAVDDFHAGCEWCVDGAAIEGARWIGVDRDERAAGDRGAVVERAAEAIDDAAEERVAGADDERAAGGFDGVVGADAGERAEGHGDGFAAVEADDFAREDVATAFDVYEVADADAGHGEAEGEASDAEDAANGAKGWDGGELGFERVDVHELGV
jgi:hypothetical protein